MSGARVRFSGDATDLVRAQEEVARGAKKMEDAFGDAGREARRLERIASKAFHESATEQEKAERKARDLNKAWKEGYLSTELYERQLKKLNEGLRDTSTKHKLLNESPMKLAAAVGSAAAGYVGISETIGRIIRQQDNWIRNQRQIAQTANQAALDVVAFAALQDDSSVIRDRTMKAVQAGSGVASTGQALNLVQSMQSAFGSFDAGLAVSKEIFRTVQAGVPIDVATELAQSAAAQGQDPTRFVRAAFSAGQVSSKDPGVVGRAAKALPGFDDKDFGWLVAAQLSGNYSGELATYTRNVGASLSGVSTLKDTFDRLGVGKGATQEQRLRALAAAGLDTTEELVIAGLTERSQAAGLADVVSAVGSGAFDRMSSGFRSLMANENLISDKRAMIEEGLPETRLQRLIAESASRIAQSRQFGDKAQGGQGTSLFAQKLAEQLNRRGIQSYFGDQLFDVDEQGNVTDIDSWKIQFYGMMGGVGNPIYNAIHEAQKETNQILRSVNNKQSPVTVTTQEK